MRTKTQCFSEVCEFIKLQTSLYEAIKTNAGWNGNREDSKLSIINAVNFWYQSNRFKEEFAKNPVDFFCLNYGTWLKYRIKKGG